MPQRTQVAVRSPFRLYTAQVPRMSSRQEGIATATTLPPRHLHCPWLLVVRRADYASDFNGFTEFHGCHMSSESSAIPVEITGRPAREKAPESSGRLSRIGAVRAPRDGTSYPEPPEASRPGTTRFGTNYRLLRCARFPPLVRRKPERSRNCRSTGA